MKRILVPNIFNIFLKPKTSDNFPNFEFTDNRISRFLFTDDFLPLSYRDMIQAWRHLRQRGENLPTDEINLSATISKNAEQGLISDVIFQFQSNPENTHLIIMVDRRGSMVPFHYLSDQIVAAVTGDAQRRVDTYYFNNCPKGNVYAQPNLSTHFIKYIQKCLKSGPKLWLSATLESCPR